VTPLGNTFASTWNEGVLQNKCGILRLTDAFEKMGYKYGRLERDLERTKTNPCQLAAPCHGISVEGNRTARVAKIALSAIDDAIVSARLQEWFGRRAHSDEVVFVGDAPILEVRRERAGVAVGTALSAVRGIAEMTRVLDNYGPRKMTPHFVPKVINNSAASRISIAFGLRGPHLCAATACAASAHSIGDAFRCIQHGQADIMLAGGSEACIDPVSLSAFSRLRALSTRNEDPDLACRPFDATRDGFVMGEGACILILEELEHARARLPGADSYIELVGYGCTGDGYHVTAPDPAGKGAIRAMESAIKQAGPEISPKDVQYVNAHATSTKLGDEIEANAIHQALCSDKIDRDQLLEVSSTKGYTGHLLGAAGAIEAAFTVQVLKDQIIPTNRNLTELDESIKNLEGIDFPRGGDPIPYDTEITVAMSNSFGFGGTNACLLFRKIDV
jgi:3-oxoacyl-[acyl-carrier-protein] synthase II